MGKIKKGESMKRFFSLTLIALLAAGITNVALGTSDWTGDATGNCQGNNVLEDWQGTLDTETYEAFIGYWGGDTDNDMYGEANQSGSYWHVDSADGYWDSDGEIYDFEGEWEGVFDESGGDMSGAWWGGPGCTDGDLDGEKE